MKKNKCFKHFFKQIILINPYFFGLILLLLLGLNFYHIFVLEPDFGLRSSFFLLYALGQSVLEVVGLVVIGNLILRYLHKSIHYLFISLCLIFLLTHFVDFILIRLMDLSFYYGINIILDETLDNFIELLYLTGINLNIWIALILMVLLFLPLLAIGTYFLMEKWAQKKPLQISYGHLTKALCLIPLGLIGLDLTFAPFLDKSDYQHYFVTLPWKSTLIHPAKEVITLKTPLKPLLSEKASLKYLHSHNEVLKKKPNIYLFIVESLREDFINLKTARHIDQFRKENISLGQTLSNANATQMSWYSIFHANYPFYWESVAKGGWKSGSLPLQMLKKHGYQVHVYSSAQLKYYSLSEVMFGKEHYLADSYQIFPHHLTTEAWESDQKVFEAFHTDLEKKSFHEGHLFIFFLDSTHFNYSWPPDYPTYFQPICDEKMYLRLSHSTTNIEVLKNRYRNAIHFIDSLFGGVVDHLKRKNIYEESIVLLMGDHGDEFLEEGQLFHASHLSWMQTRPPIYYKLGDNQIAQGKDMHTILSSQVDVFPTVLDYLFGPQPFFDLFQGESIFKEERFPFVISARYNGSRPPATFFIHDGSKKLTLRFQSVSDLFHEKQLEIIQFQDAYDKPIEVIEKDQMQTYIHSAYHRAFDRLLQ